MDAIFRNTPQALHVAYLVMSEPVREKNGLRIALIRIIEGIGTLNRRQAAWLDYLYGQKSSTVNFDGLDPLEIRGQCALITAAVIHHLTPAERCAIWVRYSKTVERKTGVIQLSKSLRAKLNLSNLDAIRYLVAEQSLPKDQRDQEKTFRYIADQTDVPVRTLERAAMMIRKQLRQLENSAYDTLTPMFERDGVVECNSREEVSA
jgi:hypothetical protein